MDAACAERPRLGATALISPTSGTVLVKDRGRHSFKHIGHPTVIQIGATVDLTSGSAHLATAKNTRGAIQSGAFQGGAFVVEQRLHQPLTTLHLVDGRTNPCSSAPKPGATGVFATAAGAQRHRLLGHAHGSFRSRGRNSTATIRGTTWITEDLCSGSTLVKAVAGGKVTARTRSTTQNLSPGDTTENFCADPPSGQLAALLDFYCTGVLYSPGHDYPGQGDTVAFSIGGASRYHNVQQPVPPPETIDACVTPAGQPTHCTTYKTDRSGGYGLFSVSDACGLIDGVPTFVFSWRINGIDVPPPMTIPNTTLHNTTDEHCLYRPTFPPYDATVYEPGNPYVP